jgi:secretion/DNA translocation related CpaE-like protein
MEVVQPVEGGPGAAPPLLVTGDRELLDELLRLCAAPGVTPDVAVEVATVRRSWWRAALVVVGADMAAEVSGWQLRRRDDVVLAGLGPGDPGLWQHAVAIGAQQVVVLPEGQAGLIDRLGDSVDGSTTPAPVVGVIGGSGGAGASTFSAALAMTAARHRRAPLLVDADPLAGGVELVVGCEDVPGIRWPDVAATRGRVSPQALRASLPAVGDLAVLSWDRGELLAVQSATMRAMLLAGRRSGGLVVVDLPRRLDDAASEAALVCDTIVLVAACAVGAVAAAARVLQAVRLLAADVRLVARQGPGAHLGPDVVAQTLDRELLGTIGTYRGLSRAVSDGIGPLARARRLERTCAAMLSSLAPLRSGR